MEWLSESNLILIKSYLLITASGIITISLFALFYIRHARQFGKEYPALSEGEFHWLIWPAIGANYFFKHVFGKRRTRFILTEQSLAKLRNENISVTTIPKFTKRLLTKLKRKGQNFRLSKKIDEFHQKWEQLSQKLSKLEAERILETRVDEKIRLEHLIDEITTQRQQIEQQLNALETQISLETNSGKDNSINTDNQPNKEQGVSQEIITKLKSLKDREYINEETFSIALEVAIGKEQAIHYKPLLLRYTEKKTRVRDLFTWRSIGATLTLSILANSICVINILVSAPEEMPQTYNRHMINTLIL